LYTAITRTRNNLLIYDAIAENRQPIEKLWSRLGVVEYGEESIKKRK
jgi:hypothetical protein